MGVRTEIGWCDSTVNPVTGCDGCELHVPGKGGTCYAGLLHEQRLAKSLPHLYAASFTEVRLVPGRMVQAAAWPDLVGKVRPDKPWLDGLPRAIFVGDMGDVFSLAVPFDYLKRELIDVVLSPRGRRHIWMVLTKRPDRMATLAAWLRDVHDIDWPDNLWPGTSLTGKASVRRIEALARVPSARRFLSVEPLVESVDLSPWLSPVSLVIVGGESGPKARPMHPDWARSIRDQCQAAGIAFHFKQWGEWAPRWLCSSTLPFRQIDLAGRDVTEEVGPHDDSDCLVCRVGKSAAGRMLDGREWNQFPESAAAGPAHDPREC